MAGGDLIVMLSQADVFRETSDQRHYLGTMGITQDGRVFRYAKMGAVAGVAGSGYSSIAAVANHLNVTCDVARAVGATKVSATLGATLATVDQYAEGYVHVNNTATIGFSYPIRRAWQSGVANAAAAQSAVLTVNLAEGVTVRSALTTSNKVTFTSNPWLSVVIAPTTVTARLVGFDPMGHTAAYYGWLQTGGPCPCLINGTVIQGNIVIRSVTTAGAVEAIPGTYSSTNANALGQLGYVIKANASADVGLVHLTIDS